MIPVLHYVKRRFARLSLARKLTAMSVVTTTASDPGCAVFLVYDFSSLAIASCATWGCWPRHRPKARRRSSSATQAAAEILKGSPKTVTSCCSHPGRDGTTRRFDRRAQRRPRVVAPADAVSTGSQWYAFTLVGLTLLRPVVFEDEPIGAVAIVADQDEIKNRAVSLGKIIGPCFGTSGLPSPWRTGFRGSSRRRFCG